MPFNLCGAIKEVNTCKSNKELVESLNRLTEEFYRTYGILFYVRYTSFVDAGRITLSQDIAQLIQNYMNAPSFDTWMRLVRLTSAELFHDGDEFAKRHGYLSVKELEGDTRAIARAVFAEILKLRSNVDEKAPRRISSIEALDIMRTLRNFRVHHWDDNKLLQPLVDAGIKSLVINVIDMLFSEIEIEILKPYSIKKDHTETYSVKAGKPSILKIPRTEQEPLLDTVHLRFYPTESPFGNPTNLVYFDEHENRVFVYAGTKDNGEAIFESVPETGGMKRTMRTLGGLESIFGLPDDISSYFSKSQTLVQKFGAISETNGVVHNLPQIVETYVSRPLVETQLVQKLAHKRLYMTTLDGGGGFGKTELAKKVIWDLMTEKAGNGSFPLDTVVWASGKITYFRDGVVEETKKTFDTLEDLLDCILYMTKNAHFINGPIEVKKSEVVSILNQMEGNKMALIVLDNLETTSQRDEIWEYLERLGDIVKSNIKVLVTSRTLGAYAVQRLNVRAMEPGEAKQLILSELDRYDVDKQYCQDNCVKAIADLSANIPLLINRFVNLLSRGYNLDELKKITPKAGEKVFDFICSFQWDELDENSRKLLMAIFKGNGKISFAQAKLVASLSNDEFLVAKEALQNRSFLIDAELINSMLAILPPIGKFIAHEMLDYPEIEDELNENMKLVELPSNIKVDQGIQSILYTDEIALNQMFQRADIMIRRGAIEDAARWYKKAVERFPESHVAFREYGEFRIKYMDDYEGGKADLEMALRLRPEDATTYNIYARCEHERGANLNLKIHLRKAIQLNEKALSLTTDPIQRRLITNFIGSSLMKLGYINRDEAFRASHGHSKPFFYESDGYFSQVTKLLSVNLIQSPRIGDEKKHNSLTYAMLASAHLTIGGSHDPSRKTNDLIALRYLIAGLKLGYPNTQLIYLLGHQGIIAILRERYGMDLFGISQRDRIAVVPKVVALESLVTRDLGGA